MAIKLNLDTIRNLESNKTYYLSNKTGEIKEAGVLAEHQMQVWIQKRSPQGLQSFGRGQNLSSSGIRSQYQ